MRIIACIALAGLSGIAAADVPPVDSEPPWLGFFNGRYPMCSISAYDKEAIAQNPPKIAEAILAYSPSFTPAGAAGPVNNWFYDSGKGYVNILVALKLQGADRYAGREFNCGEGKDENELLCTLDGDPGSITLTHLGKGDPMRVEFTQSYEAYFAPKAEGAPATVTIDPSDQKMVTVVPAPGKPDPCAPVRDAFYPGATFPAP